MIFAISVLGLSAQNKPISGTVTDAAGVPVIGAAVYVVGNVSSGVMTDEEGRYNLQVPQNSTIAVSCIGYATQTFKASEMPASITMAEDAMFLDDVVVTNADEDEAAQFSETLSCMFVESNYDVLVFSESIEFSYEPDSGHVTLPDCQSVLNIWRI